LGCTYYLEVVRLASYTIEWRGNGYTNSSSRYGCRVDGIINHITAGTASSTDFWFRDPSNKGSSAHYLVTRLGKIRQYVDDSRRAWHAGIVQRATSKYAKHRLTLGVPGYPGWRRQDPNFYTIGIEYECISGGELTDKQLAAGVWLTTMLCNKHNIPMNRVRIFGHSEIDMIDRPFDPGPSFPWDELMKRVKGGVSMKEVLENIDQVAKALGLPDVSGWAVKAKVIKSAIDMGIMKDEHDVNQPLVWGEFVAVQMNVVELMKNYTDKQIDEKLVEFEARLFGDGSDA